MQALSKQEKKKKDQTEKMVHVAKTPTFERIFAQARRNREVEECADFLVDIYLEVTMDMNLPRDDGSTIRVRKLST